jgi:hypothetical protein
MQLIEIEIHLVLFLRVVKFRPQTSSISANRHHLREVVNGGNASRPLHYKASYKVGRRLAHAAGKKCVGIWDNS